MVHRKRSIHCSYANALYLAQAIQWDKCNLTRFSTNFRFEDSLWMIPRATENAVATTCGPRAYTSVWSHATRSWTTLTYMVSENDVVEAIVELVCLRR